MATMRNVAKELQPRKWRTEATHQQYQQAAKRTFAKQKTVNVRISERNLLRLKEAAAKEGVSYQTLITSLIHKHI